ncbi:MAG: transglutaminase domain-containing protein [Planctomycetes bacterium]|nr:transglutaminase domain-containing protein [Planctomycetota bacterium]
MKTRILGIWFIVLQLAVLALGQTDDIEYYAVFVDGTKVGHAMHSRVVAGEQVTTTETANMTLNRMGKTVLMKTKETCVETIKGEPISFAAEQDMGMVTMKTEGTIGRNGMVRTRTTGIGTVQDGNMAWPKGAVMAEGLRLIELEKKLNEGTSYDVSVFSPGIMAAVNTRVKVGAKQDVDLLGRIVPLTKVETVMSMPGTGEIVSTGYVDEQLRALKSIMLMAGMNVEMLACTKEFAMSNNQPAEIVDKMFLASPEPIEDAGAAKSITYYLKPTAQTTNLTIPSSDNQRVGKLEDGTVIVKVEPVSMPTGGTIPYRGTDANIAEMIKPGRFVQSDDANIIALAKQAVGDTKDSAEAAKKIEEFAAKYIKNISLSVGYASATEVAASRRGDCTEFAVLCAAMCRAAGIPAKVTVGVAYVNDFEGRSGFGGHAWTEAYIGDKWVGLDSAFKAGGLGKFDAGHIALASGNGEPVNFFNMATTLGNFKIGKVTVER